MTETHRESSNEAEIRALIEARVQAVHAKALEAANAHHAPDVVAFDVVNPLQYRGAETVRQRTQEWFSVYPGPIGYEVRDLSITAGDDVAFCHYLYHVTGTAATGAQVDMWVRATVCFQKIESRWALTHDHESVPFDPQTGKASLDLKP
jgi:uncharacterized protein (TIGR02246 family)